VAMIPRGMVKSLNHRHKTTSVTLINYHFVWIPKRRKKVLTGNVAIRLEELLYEKSKDLDCEILALEIMEDHVHLFLSCPPTRNRSRGWQRLP